VVRHNRQEADLAKADPAAAERSNCSTLKRTISVIAGLR
jgi:hypothetical protein